MLKEKIKLQIRNAEKIAVKFTLHSLEAVLCGYCLLYIYILRTGFTQGIDYFRNLEIAGEVGENLFCAFFLSLLCGAFIDMTMKAEKKEKKDR